MDRFARLTAAGVGAAALALYVSTAAPNAYWGDGPELASAASALGIGHPTGYPLYMLVAHAAIRLMSWIEPGRATTALNAVLLAAACGMSVLLFRRVLRASSVCAFTFGAGLAALLAVARTVWEHATITEVYPLTYFMCIAVLGVAWTEPGAQPRLRRAALLGGLVGLASLNHYSILAYYPLAGLVVIEWVWKRSAREKLKYIGAGICCWVVMLAGYAYLPLRARANPALNWGDPQTPERMLYMLTGGEFRRLNFLYWEMTPREGMVRWLAWWAKEWIPNCPTALAAMIGAVALGLALAGLAALSKRRPALGIGLALAMLATAFFSVYYRISDIGGYFMPALPAAAIGWIEAGRMIVRRRLPAWTSAVIPLIVLIVAVGRYREVDKSWDRMPEIYGEQVLSALPPNAIVLVEGDNQIFPLWYQQIALGRRPDVSVVAPEFVLHGWYGKYFEAAGRPRIPIKIEGRRARDKRDFDIAAICNVILPCFKAGHRIFATYPDDIQIAFFSPQPVKQLPPNRAYREIVHSDVGLPATMLYELKPNPALASMTRDQIWAEINRVVDRQARQRH